MPRLSAAALTVMVLSSGCYLSFEREVAADAAVGVDAAVPIDAARPDGGGACSLLAPTSVYLEPPLPATMGSLPITLEGFEADPASLGLRFHLNACPGAESPCLHDAIVVGIGADIATRFRVPPSGAQGLLDWDGSTQFHLWVQDYRRCASCGGEVEVIAGSLDTRFASSVRTFDGPVDCAGGCGDFLGVTAERGDSSLTAAQGGTVQVGPALLRVTADAVRPCVRCDCAFPGTSASGLYVWSSGVAMPPD